MRRFIIIGRTASGTGKFSLENLPSSSGRLDVLLRCVRAALLTSHGLRRNVVVYLVLLGKEEVPRVVRLSGDAVQFVRPDERSLALLVQKALLRHAGGSTTFIEQKPGLAVADGELELVLSELGGARRYLLELGAPDARDAVLEPDDAAFFIGDHSGFAETTRAALIACGAEPLGVGPLGLHSDDVVTLVLNELDRRAAEGRK